MERVRDFVRRSHSLDLPKVVVEQPPKVELGEYALPLAFELAKKLRKPPRNIAQEIISGLGSIEGFEKLEVAGAGYINARVNRAELAESLASDVKPRAEAPPVKFSVSNPATTQTKR